MELAHATWPRDRTQVMHLAVTGVLMHAGYLGGVWAAVKLGLGAGTIALLVGLQPVLTALWVTAAPGSDKRHAVNAQQWTGLALGLAGLTLVVWRKLGAGEVTAVNLSLAILALLCITTGTLYQKRFVAPCDVRTASAIQLVAALIVSLPIPDGRISMINNKLIRTVDGKKQVKQIMNEDHRNEILEKYFHMDMVYLV